MIRKALVLIFLGLNTAWDIRIKKLPLWLIAVYGLAGVAVNVIEPYYRFIELVCGVGVGLAVLLAGIITKEQIGKGDGLFLMATGLFVGGENNFRLLLWSTILCAVAAGLLLLTKQCGRKERLPFVPFVLCAYVVSLLI